VLWEETGREARPYPDWARTQMNYKRPKSLRFILAAVLSVTAAITIALPFVVSDGIDPAQMGMLIPWVIAAAPAALALLFCGLCGLGFMFVKEWILLTFTYSLSIPFWWVIGWGLGKLIEKKRKLPNK
jgi:hypothetical protein